MYLLKEMESILIAHSTLSFFFYSCSEVVYPSSQSAVADDPSSKEVEKFSCAVDGIARKMEGIKEEVTGIEKVGGSIAMNYNPWYGEYFKLSLEL